MEKHLIVSIRQGEAEIVDFIPPEELQRHRLHAEEYLASRMKIMAKKFFAEVDNVSKRV